MTKAVRLKFFTLLFCAAILQSHCTSLKMLFSDPIPPKVSFQSITFKSLSLKAIHLEVTLNIRNKNDFPLQGSNFSYKFLLFNNPIAKGQIKGPLILKEEKATEVNIPIRISITKSLKAFTKSLENPNPPPMIIKGEGVFDSPVGGFDIEFSEKIPFNELRKSLPL